MNRRAAAAIALIAIVAPIACPSFVPVAHGQGGTPTAALLVRQPAKPAWEVDVTDELKLLSPDAVDVATAATADVVADYATAMSRDARAARVPTPSARLWWRLELALPEGADANWPVVLEADEARFIVDAAVDGEELRFHGNGHEISSGLRFARLPLSGARRKVSIVLQQAWQTPNFINGIGRLRLRPAEVGEFIDVDRDDNGNAVRVINRSTVKLPVKLDVRTEDYFGVVLGSESFDALLEPGEERAKTFAYKLPDKGERYKSVFRPIVGTRSGLEYWRYYDDERIIWARPQQQRITEGWQQQMSPGAPGDEVPQEGWRDSGPTEEERRQSDFRWHRRTFKVPQDWEGKRYALYFTSIGGYAKIYCDGKKIDERPGVRVPDYIYLPDTIKAGDAFEIALVIQGGSYHDAPGKNGGNSRGRAGPNTGNGFEPVHFVALPAVRTDFTFIRTKTVGETRLDATLELRNDLKAPQTVSGKATVYARGKAIGDIAIPSTRLAPGTTKSIEIKKAFPQAQLWEVDAPSLHEMRIELKDARGTVVDARRDRFGFREFDIKGDHFVLNGKRLNFHGGSHTMPLSNTWPVRPHPYRWVRHYWNYPNGFMCGIGYNNACDEMGILLKTENGHLNALHQETYAFELPIFWERTRLQMTQYVRSTINHPAVVMYDIGNELNFSLKGETEKVLTLYNDIRKVDPTRSVTNSGGAPDVPGAPMWDIHGMGSWRSPAEYFLTHPEERPGYAKDGGAYTYRPKSEPEEKWTVVNSRKTKGGWGWPWGGYADRKGELLALAWRPLFNSEGHYSEAEIEPEITGQSIYLPVPAWRGSDDRGGWPFGVLSYYGHRQHSLPMIRNANIAGTMVHVDRGVGRWIAPLAILPIDRNWRVEAGSKLVNRFNLINDVSQPLEVTATFTLYDGKKKVGEDKVVRRVQPGQPERHTLQLTVPASTKGDGEYRLHVEATAKGFGGHYREDFTVAAFGPDPLAAPQGRTLVVYDPRGSILPYLTQQQGMTARPIASLSEWTGDAATPLLVGPEALDDARDVERADLKRKVNAGGRVAVLQHKSLPTFLNQVLTPRGNSQTAVTLADSRSTVTRGLMPEDLRFWNTADRDWIVFWNAIEIPTTGNRVAYAESKSASPLLEVGEGAGTVLFCQLNLTPALATEPAARRVLSNVLAWTGETVAHGPSLIVSSNASLIGSLKSRWGVEGDVVPQLDDAEQFAGRKLVILDGRDAPSRTPAAAAALRAFADAGGTVFVQGLDDAGAAWLGEAFGRTIGVEPLASDRAYWLDRNDVNVGLTHGALFWFSGSQLPERYHDQGKEPGSRDVAHHRLTGNLTPLTDPAYLGQFVQGKGRVVINMTRSVDNPIRVPVGLLSSLLHNVGASLRAGGVNDGALAAGPKWAFTPFNLGAHANHSLIDDTENNRRGWTNVGPGNDMRTFPRGRQTFKGVEYDLIDPDRHDGKGVVALSGTREVGILPPAVKDIAIDTKAERLYFLHNSAWGVPGFTYRVWYKEDRAKWIPGMPDPYVDVAVKPQEHIADWFFAGEVERGERILPGATVAWSGETPTSRGYGQRVGVYQFAWDNPNPEKVIGSVDVLSPGTVGDGQLFVFAITAATRADGPASGAKPALSQIDPKLDPKDVHEHFFNGRYGAVVLKDSTFFFHDGAGRKVLSMNGFNLGVEPGRRPTEMREAGKYDKAQRDLTYRFRSTVGDDGSTTISTEPTLLYDGRIAFVQRLVMRPGSIRLEQDFKVVRELASGTKLSVGNWFYWPDELIAPAERDRLYEPNINPLVVPYQFGMGSIQFDDSFVPGWFINYWVRDNSVTWRLFRDAAKQQVGGEEKFWLEISLP